MGKKTCSKPPTRSAIFFTRSRSPDHQIMSPTWRCHQLLIDRNGILLSQEGNGLTSKRCKRGLILRTGDQAFPEINEVWDDDDYYYYRRGTHGGRRCANCRNAHFLRGTVMKASSHEKHAKKNMKKKIRPMSPARPLPRPCP